MRAEPLDLSTSLSTMTASVRGTLQPVDTPFGPWLRKRSVGLGSVMGLLTHGCRLTVRLPAEGVSVLRPVEAADYRKPSSSKCSSPGLS